MRHQAKPSGPERQQTPRQGAARATASQKPVHTPTARRAEPRRGPGPGADWLRPDEC